MDLDQFVAKYPGERYQAHMGLLLLSILLSYAYFAYTVLICYGLSCMLLAF